MSAWRNPPSGERHSAPVEMRFVDMFMAALGALVFMAMLLAFLLRFMATPVPQQITNKEQHYDLKQFQIATKTLPPARAGQAYELAFAFRGGLPPATWEIAAGGGDIPPGLRFDVTDGALIGIPAKSGHARFVLRASDQNGGSDSRAYDLDVLEPVKGSKRVERSLSILMFFAAFLLWLLTARSPKHIRGRIQSLEKAHDEGKTAIRFVTGPGTHEEIRYVGGLETLQRRLKFAIQTRRFFGLILLALLAWLIWRLWFA